jgi:phosphoenolpyruvate carboxykinase (GTP)
VLIDENGLPHWTGNGEAQPTRGRNFQGPWKKGLKDAGGKEIPISHPNARCTIASTALANYSESRGAGRGGNPGNHLQRAGQRHHAAGVGAKNADHGVVIGACIVSAATATEVGASGVKRAPWANAPFIPGALGDYMKAQFDFFGSSAIADGKRPIMAGLNYFLTHEARGGKGKKLLGEKKDVKVWLGWLERRAHGDVDAIETPIGFIPRYDDLKALFETLIDKPYPKALYDQQFSLYVDNILARIDLQTAAYGKEENIPGQLFDVLREQRDGLIDLKTQFGPVVKPEQLLEG